MNRVPDVLICCLLRVNYFMLMAQLAQYWLMDFYSQVLDQRMSIIQKIKTQIMMGQTRQISNNLTEHEEQDRHAAGYIDEPKNELYLPSSVHGSPCHMTALEKNASVLVSEFGCLHVFITLTCNPWLGMSGFVSVGYTPQMTDICVCCRHVENVCLTRRRHSVMSAFFFADKVVSGETVTGTASYKYVGISTRNSRGIVGK